MLKIRSNESSRVKVDFIQIEGGFYLVIVEGNNAMKGFSNAKKFQDFDKAMEFYRTYWNNYK